MLHYWLFKSEPDVFSFDDLKRDGTTPWSGVRNWQARRNMQEMRAGDLGFFYHSSCAVPGAVGICRVVRTAYPDFTQFDAASEYFDSTSRPEHPKWYMVDVEYVEPLPNAVTLARVRAEPRLAEMTLVRNSRLSVQPVTPEQWQIMLELARETTQPA